MTDPIQFILSDPHFEAEILYLLPEDVGRSLPVSSAYRGQFYYDGKNWDTCQQFLDKEICEPGETVKVLMQTTSPGIHAEKLFVNKRFEIREGSKVVGIGKISKILLRELEKKEPDSYELKIIDLVIRKNSFGITSVNNLDSVKSTYYIHADYPAIAQLISQKKWYAIDDSVDTNPKKEFYEYLYVYVFSDQNGKEYAATIFDNDELWHDATIIEIIALP